MVFGDRFNYPVIDESMCNNCGKCQKACPSLYLTHDVKPDIQGVGLSRDYKYFLIHHSDTTLRHDAASGGFVTGIISYLIEKGLADGGIVAKGSPDNALESISFIARNKEELLSSRGSRYAPVSNCTPIKDILKLDGRYIFMGKPCEVDAVNRLIKVYPDLQEKIILKISFICAGTAARSSTKLFIKRYLPDIDLKSIGRITYRGGGWPGFFRVYDRNNSLILKRDLIGDELDNLVPRDHLLRCNLCMDQWGMAGDISVSDPWCKEFVETETEGRTAIVVRSEHALDYIKSAVTDKVMIADEIQMENIQLYQNDIVVNSAKRKSWMSAYALFFLAKIRYPFSAVRYKGKGFKSVLRAKSNKHYFQNE